MNDQKFELVSSYKPSGSQPEAIKSLVQGIKSGMKEQTLLGVTGSGKTFTMANVIAQVNKPTLVLAHNKTLAAQLCSEFKEFFPHNAVEYFVSYYDYYQPEAYIPNTDTYIEKVIVLRPQALDQPCDAAFLVSGRDQDRKPPESGSRLRSATTAQAKQRHRQKVQGKHPEDQKKHSNCRVHSFFLLCDFLCLQYITSARSRTETSNEGNLKV